MRCSDSIKLYNMGLITVKGVIFMGGINCGQSNNRSPHNGRAGFSIFPQISIGLGTNSIKESAIIHAIDECVGSYKGLLFESFHGRINYSELNSRAVAKHIIKTKVSTTFSNSISNLNLEELMKNTETFFAIINSQCGYTVKAFSTKLQPETLVDTTPLTSRLLLRTNRPLIKGCMPFW